MGVELVVTLWVGLRVLPLGLALGSFTRGFVPLPIALSLTFALTFALLPAAGRGDLPPDVAALAAAGVRELCIGATFALALTFALEAARWVVHLSDGHEANGDLRRALARPYALCAIWLAISLRAPQAVLIGLAESFEFAPLGAGVFSASGFALGLAQLTSAAIVTAIGFALPLIVSAWLISVTLALVARAVGPRGFAPPPLLSGLLLMLAAALLLVPIAARAPEGVRLALQGARDLTRAFTQ